MDASFDTIPHSELLKSIAARISDRTILRLIKMWLKAPVEERDENGGKRMSGGKNAKKGTPQGGVISPLLANRYMNRFLKYWEKTDQPRRLRARIVSYADDFVILSRGKGAEALDWTRRTITRLGLALNEAKTSAPRGKSCLLCGERFQDFPRIRRTGILLILVQLIGGKFD